MKELKNPISIAELSTFANCMNPEWDPLVKAVVDITTSSIVIGASMHVDEEEYLIDSGSEQSDLWGINLYPSLFWKDEFIEFDSMINLRPSGWNKSRSVEDPHIQKTIRSLIWKYIIHGK